MYLNLNALQAKVFNYGDQFLFSLTSQQKKIAIVAGLVFTALAAIFFCCNYFFKACKQEEKDQAIDSQPKEPITEADLAARLPSLSLEEKNYLNKCNPYMPNVYMSAYPGDKEPSRTEKMHAVLKEKGVTAIVSLIPDNEMQWKKFKPYTELARSVNPGVSFLKLPIQDVSVTDDESVRKFIREELIPLSSDPNQVILVHCHGGNGRSSTIAVIHLSMQYNLSFHDSLRHVFKCYLTRKDPLKYIPESEEQFEQMKRLCTGEPSALTFEEWRKDMGEMVLSIRPELADRLY